MTDIQSALDIVSRMNGYGSRRMATANLLYGINQRGTGTTVSQNRDSNGLVFFTRPRLNLTYSNIIADRVMTTLLAGGVEESYQAAIRALLDPVAGGKQEFGKWLAPNTGLDLVSSKLINPRLPFMAVLTNTLETLNGWPDPQIDKFTSHEGIMKEAWAMADGQSKIYTTFELTANFRNVAGDPISFLFYVWTRFMGNMVSGDMVPYPDDLLLNRINYNTRIYRFILDASRQYITGVAATGASFPYSAALGSKFDFSREAGINQDRKEISIPFQCMGAEYNDPITLLEFNRVVREFNHDMENPAGNGYIKLSPGEINYYLHFGYPLANERTFELEWWIDPADYDKAGTFTTDPLLATTRENRQMTLTTTTTDGALSAEQQSGFQGFASEFGRGTSPDPLGTTNAPLGSANAIPSNPPQQTTPAGYVGPTDTKPGNT